TDASFGPVSPGPSGRFPSVFPTLPDPFPAVSGGICFQWPLESLLPFGFFDFIRIFSADRIGLTFLIRFERGGFSGK
ncbi:hypothetical protein, partial [Streptomyces zagrosensis]|uniref:hypothetical protein n=1 Tax=Streptomyces zagrosensis TaxID=1042984 RepID=UPI001C871552